MDSTVATVAWLDAVRRTQLDFARQADRTRLLPRPHTGKLTDIVEGALTQAGVRPPQQPQPTVQPAAATATARVVDIVV